MRAKARKQIQLHLPTWGGKRKGAGAKPAGARAGVPHVRRPPLSPHHPAHVTLRVLPHVWNLRSRRALLAQPRILILDEATSSLDSESESMIQDGLKDLRRGRTTFVVEE